MRRKKLCECNFLNLVKISFLFLFLCLISVNAQMREQRVVSLDKSAALRMVTDYDATAYPYNAVARVISTFKNCGMRAGSGAFVSADGVFTAAHVVYDEKCGKAEEVVIIPGYNNGQEPFGRYKAKQIEVPPQYMNNKDSNYDFAAIRTEGRTKGDFFGYGTPPGNLGNILILGYPKVDGKYDGQRLYYKNGSASLVYSNTVAYPINTYSGMSGGPILQENGIYDGIMHYRVIGVHARGDESAIFPVNFGAGFLNDFLRNFPRRR